MSHMDAVASDSWVIQKKWPKRLLWGGAVVAAIGLLLLSCIGGHTTDRSRVGELMLLTAESKAKVETALLENTSQKVNLNAASLIPSALGAKSKDGEKIEIAYRDISEKGEIKVYSPQLGVLLILTPTLIDRQVSWSCWGRPLNKVPTACRGSS